MSNFVVKYKNMYELLWRFKTELESIQLTSDLLKEYIAKYLDDGSMYGQTSEAMYSYFNEVHGGMLDSMKSIAQSLLDTIAGYKAGYYSIDASTNFVLPESNIDSSRERFNAIGDSFMEQYQKVNDTINGISDIVSYTCPDYQGIPDIHTSINNELPVLVDNVNEYEASTVTSLDGTIDPMIAIFMESLNSLFIPSAVSIDSYRSGSFGANGCVQAMMYMNDIMNEHHEEIEEFLTEVWDNETALRKQADDRITQGVWQIVGGVALVATGVVCIVFSAGAATPIVVTAWVAGGGTALFGTAEMIEGGEHVYYGSIGDINSQTFNYIRDTVFFGDQKVYNITENIFSFVAGAMVPIEQSYKAAELTFRSGGMILLKEGAGQAAGFGATWAASKVTDNRVIQLMSGIAASALTSKGIDKLDDYYNLSRKPFINGMSDYDAQKYSMLQSLDDEEHMLYNKMLSEKFSVAEMDDYLFAEKSERFSVYNDIRKKHIIQSLDDGELSVYNKMLKEKFTVPEIEEYLFAENSDRLLVYKDIQKRHIIQGLDDGELSVYNKMLDGKFTVPEIEEFLFAENTDRLLVYRDIQKRHIIQGLDKEELGIYNKMLDEKYSVPEIEEFLFAEKSERLSLFNDIRKNHIIQGFDAQERILYDMIIAEKFTVPEVEEYLFAAQSERLSIYYDAKLKKLYSLANGSLDDAQKMALAADMKAFYDGTDVRCRGDLFVPEAAEDIDYIYYDDKNTKKYFINYNWKGIGTVRETRCMKVMKAGECFDRVGSPTGRCVGYIGEDGICATHQQRSLPYHFTESDITQEPSYHLYKAEKDFTRDNIIKAIDASTYKDTVKAELKKNLDIYYANKKIELYGDGDGLAFGEIKPMFENTTGATGGGFQYDMPLNMEQLINIGMIKEIKIEKYFEKVN